MKATNILLIGAIALGGYLLLKNKTSYPTDDNYGAGYGLGSGYQSAPGTQPALLPKVQEVQPIGQMSADIFKTTSEYAPDRFINAPNSGGGGVYDRYAQQSIRTETANIRSIFGTPGISSAVSSAINNQVSEKVKDIFKAGLNPQSR